MKTVHAVILIVACVAIAIVGGIAMMNIHTVDSSSANVKTNDDSWEGIDKMMHKWDGVPSESAPKADPRLIPAIMLIAGSAGLCYGAYCLVTNYPRGKKLPKGGPT